MILLPAATRIDDSCPLSVVANTPPPSIFSLLQRHRQRRPPHSLLVLPPLYPPFTLPLPSLHPALQTPTVTIPPLTTFLPSPLSGHGVKPNVLGGQYPPESGSDAMAGDYQGASGVFTANLSRNLFPTKPLPLHVSFFLPCTLSLSDSFFPLSGPYSYPIFTPSRCNHAAHYVYPESRQRTPALACILLCAIFGFSFGPFSRAAKHLPQHHHGPTPTCLPSTRL